MASLSTYLPAISYGTAAPGLMVSLALYAAALVIYRLFFSPLAGFPGPKMAAATGYYESYYDMILKGQYVFKIKEMHQTYGPIIRINPHEISIDDPDYYDEVYVAGSKRRTEGYSHFGQGIDFEGTHILTTDHDLHRQRRKPLEPYFSRAGVSKLEPMVYDLVDRLVGRLEALKGTRTVVRVDHAFHAFTGDVIGRICFEDSLGFLADSDFAPQWFDLTHSFVRSIPIFMGFPFLIKIVSLIPQRLLSWIHPRSQSFNQFKTLTETHIINTKNEGTNFKKRNIGEKTSLFHHIFNSEMPTSELSTERLTREAQVILGAGSLTTTRTLSSITYYTLANKHFRSTLREELRDVMAQYPEKKPSWADLQKLPYLQAIIKEGLRLTYGVMHRLPRVSPDVPLQYKGWTIPAGVPVGMSAYMMHSDPQVYEKPFEFLPDRWLGDVSLRMKKSLVSFTRGSRSCLGVNLAYTELNFVVAVLFRPEGPAMDLFETDESDVTLTHDYLAPLPKLDTKGVRVMIP